MTISPYILWTDFWEHENGGYMNIGPIAINTNGSISYDPYRHFGLFERSYFAPAAFVFNNTPYMVWTSLGFQQGGIGTWQGRYINIAPFAINTNGSIL